MDLDIQLRVSVAALFIDSDEVLLIHQITPPEPDCWDLPGGGLNPGETLLQGLTREIQEETGLEQFQVDGILTVVEGFFPQPDQQIMHTLNIVYNCSLNTKPSQFISNDPEIGHQGIRWMPISELHSAICSNRAWMSLQAAGFI